tara:strand:- start:180 stop:617 length:438 start_codon:yes stop_codon:yes gene_type:complete
MEKSKLEDIINSYKWIKVKGYNPIDYDNCVDGLDGLEKHHIEETTFLIDKCRELAKELLKQKYNTMVYDITIDTNDQSISFERIEKMALETAVQSYLNEKDETTFDETYSIIKNELERFKGSEMTLVSKVLGTYKFSIQVIEAIK